MLPSLSGSVSAVEKNWRGSQKKFTFNGAALHTCICKYCQFFSVGQSVQC